MGIINIMRRREVRWRINLYVKILGWAEGSYRDQILLSLQKEAKELYALRKRRV